MRSKLLTCLLAVTSILYLPLARAGDDYLIIVNKDNANTVTSDFVAKAYRGEAKTWPAGGSVTTVTLYDESATRAAFDKAVLGKSPGQSRAMWAQLTFTGKAVPPKMVESDEEAIKVVSENKNAIGYVSPKANVGAVKVVK
jgi:ABC-type phosphate transport system substrate-binding protein